MMLARGFTFVELVLVLAIIATLAAILFPVYAASREATRSTSCKANLLNIFVALRIYAADFGGVFPPERPGLAALIRLDLIDEQSLRCPSAPQGPLVRGAIDWLDETNVPPYLYVPGLTYPPSDHKLVVADSRPRHRQTANALFADGAIRPLPVPLWLRFIPRPVGEDYRIFPPSPVRSGGDQP